MVKPILFSFVLAMSLSALASAKDVKDVTGCLAKGDNAKEFVITANDGSTWEVRSDKVNLADHVGHTVTATGVVSNKALHDMKEGAKETVNKDSTEHGHLTVTDVKMVSDSCSK